jgi:hypothetical protein
MKILRTTKLTRVTKAISKKNSSPKNKPRNKKKGSPEAAFFLLHLFIPSLALCARRISQTHHTHEVYYKES